MVISPILTSVGIIYYQYYHLVTSGSIESRLVTRGHICPQLVSPVTSGHIWSLLSYLVTPGNIWAHLVTPGHFPKIIIGYQGTPVQPINT